MSDRTRVLRYKRSALASMGAQEIMLELESIVEACDGIRYYIEQADGDETLLNALDGDEDEAWEFRMAFADLSAQADQLQTTLYNQYFEDFYREFDDATVALIGNRYNLVGYDSEEEDYFSLTSYEENLAQTEAGKRLCRLTKAEMLSRIGWAFGVMLAFFDLRQKYDYLKATFDILRDENTSLLGIIKDIEKSMKWTQTISENGQTAQSILIGCLLRFQTTHGWNRQTKYISYLCYAIAVTVRFQGSRTVFLCPVICQVRIVPIFYRLFRHFAHSQLQHLVVSYSRLFDTTTRRHIMQYTDNEAALIGGLISTYFLRPAVSAALKDSYIHVLEHLHTGRVSAADLKQIQKALTFLTPTCQLSREAQRDLMGASLKTTALLSSCR